MRAIFTHGSKEGTENEHDFPGSEVGKRTEPYPRPLHALVRSLGNLYQAIGAIDPEVPRQEFIRQQIERPKA